MMRFITCSITVLQEINLGKIQAISALKIMLDNKRHYPFRCSDGPNTLVGAGTLVNKSIEGDTLESQKSIFVHSMNL